MTRPHQRRLAAITASLLTVAALLTGCSGGGASSSGPSKQNSDVLNIALNTAPNTLDPALGGNGDPIVIPYELAYEPLIYRLPDGSYGPGLATEFGYTDDQNKVFELTLRKGVTFSDGSPLTADAVKASLEYYGKAGGPFAGRLQQFQSIDVTGPLSVRITLKTSNPNLPYLLMQRSTLGDIISPEGLKNPKSLGTNTAGAGPYKIDTSATVSGQTYTFVPNEKYWNKEAVHFKKVVLKVISDPNATLSALKSGQVDYAFGNARTAGDAKRAGFQVLTSPYIFAQVQIMDRDGVVVKALGDQRVRQALAMSIDREAVAKALFGEYGGVDNQSSVPGAEGYSKDLENVYPYDLKKAKALLKEAGYPNGFELPMTAFNLQPGETDAAQAIASAWSQIGVTVKIDVPTSLNEFITKLSSKQSPNMMFFYGVNPMSVMFSEWSGNGYGNPFGVDDPELEAIYAAANAEPDKDKRDVLWVKLQARLQELAWMVPFAYQDKIVIARPGLDKIALSPSNLDPNPVYFEAKK